MPATEKLTILVVDDEAEIRKLVGAMVSQAGSTILTAASGARGLADRLPETQPDRKVLYISGYDSTHVVQKYVVEKGHALLSKPFTVEEMRRKMTEGLPPAVSNA